MKMLSLAVAVFSVITLWVSQTTDHQILLLLFIAGLALSVTTFLSRGKPGFLKIFSTLFAVETVIFGSVALAVAGDIWPSALAALEVPETLPLTVAVFGIAIYLISHIPVIRKMTNIADPFFQTDDLSRTRIWPYSPFPAREGLIACAMVVFLVVLNQAEVFITVRLNTFNRDWFDAIQNKDAPTFWHQLLWVFVPWAVVFISATIIEFVVQSYLIIRWRRWLTERYVGRWLQHNVHYHMALARSDADNPDQRIAEDIRAFIDPDVGLYGYSITLISSLTSLVSFSIVLWNLSANFVFPGTNLALPGLLFWVVLAYTTIGTLITHLIGRPLSKLYFAQQRFEADFRFSIARLREYTEQVALLFGEPAERSFAMARFANIYDNFLRIVHVRRWLSGFTSLYGQVSGIIPFVFAAPFYFAGKISLGVMTQTASAFSRVDSALNFFVTYYVSLANFKAVLDRLTTFDEASVAASRLGTEPPSFVRLPAPGKSVHLRELQIALPDGRPIVSVPQLEFFPGQSTLLTGPSGSGKSTLFRVISGIWPFGHGQITIPDKAEIMLLPQRPYIPMGSLRDAIVYPAPSGAYEDDQIRAALVAVKLGDFADRLQENGGWAQRLSGGEQQRVAIARALLAKPDWLFLDEATSALDEKNEGIIYQAIAERLPNTTLVSIGHRATLLAMHRRHIDMQAAAGSHAFSPRDIEPALASVGS
jgi:vitamin B12/bleomycin/antimicrobial peptide transport system ATP-binding/permease protein